jgi:hypothetical protein
LELPAVQSPRAPGGVPAAAGSGGAAAQPGPHGRGFATIAFNTATSFATNTNWQAYGGEMTMSYLSQMLALTVQNFVSAAAGMAVLDRADPRPVPPLHAHHRQLLG